MRRLPWIVVAVLVVAEVGLAQLATARARDRHVTYVFTPLVDVVPGGVPLSAGEATDLAADARNQVDARDIQQAYARMGSTISLDDLLRGVESLDGTEHALDAGQKQRVRAILEGAQANHGAVIAVQDEILRDEADVSSQVEAILASLPEDVRARVEARAAAGAKPGKPPGPPGPPGNAPPTAPSEPPTAPPDGAPSQPPVPR